MHATAGTLAFASLIASLLAAAPASAFPDGVPWEEAKGEVCHACHFDRPLRTGSSALALEGLPAAVEAGARYRLTIRLEEEAMRRAGFLLSVLHRTEEVGRVFAEGERAETRGARARSTTSGSALSGSGASAWTVTWQAPAQVPEPVTFEIWSVAANGDESPLGDRVHEFTVELSRAAAAIPARQRVGRDTAHDGSEK